MLGPKTQSLLEELCKPLDGPKGKELGQWCVFEFCSIPTVYYAKDCHQANQFKKFLDDTSKTLPGCLGAEHHEVRFMTYEAASAMVRDFKRSNI